MKGIFLCGGIGRRMSPFTEDKFLFKFLGKTLLQYQIEQAKKAGLTELILIGNPTNIDKIKSTVEKVSGASIEFVVQRHPKGMADAILSASDLLSDSPFILINSNDIFDNSAYVSLLDEYQNDGVHSSYITARQVQEYFPGGYLVVDNKDGEISRIVEKPKRGAEPSNLVNIVAHLHKNTQQLIEYLGRINSTEDDVYERSLNMMIDRGLKMKAITYTGSWQAIKFPWHILEAMDYFLNRVKRRILPSAKISDKAIVDGDVVIGRNAKVLEGAVIRGPSYIGENSIIGNGVLVRNSMIGDDCVVGYGTEIKHSYISDGCWFHMNYFGDSVVGNDCSFGAGTITANLRLDEGSIKVNSCGEKSDTGLDKLGALIGDGVRTGINVSLMPGVRVGERCFIGPHVCLTHDLTTGATAMTDSNYRVVNSEVRIGS